MGIGLDPETTEGDTKGKQDKMGSKKLHYLNFLITMFRRSRRDRTVGV